MSGKRSGEGLGGLLKGLGELVEKLGELAEKGESLSRSGEIDFERQGKGVKGFYGFSVKMGLGDQEMKVEPFGNIRKEEGAGESVIHEVREPMVDIFEEADHTLVVAEMPGVATDDVRLEVRDDLLSIRAESADKKYQKELLLPRSYSRDRIKFSCNNGILEIKCMN